MVAHSRCKQEINLVLTSIYKANYPNQWSHIMSKTNLTLAFDQNYEDISSFSLSQVLVKHVCARGRKYCHA